MKKRGRLACVFSSIAIQLFHIFSYDYVSVINVVVILISIVLFYFFGFQYDKTAYYANKDLLTNLYNRRYVERMFPKLRLMSRKTRRCLFVLFIDCDHFKQINDHFSRQIGDRVLHQLGQLLEQEADTYDTIARWGGDEFLVLGLRDNPAKINDFILNIRNRIKREISFANGIPISISVGVAIAPHHHITLSELLHIADQNMYDQKNNRQEETEC